MAQIRDIADSIQNETTDQIALWWQEAERAVQAGRMARAQRFLRWILAAQPDDQEAWLRLAELAPNPKARLAYLRQAYVFHPGSERVQNALRQARTCQLESAAGDLDRQLITLRRLPGKRSRAERQPDQPIDRHLPRPRFQGVAARARTVARRQSWIPTIRALPSWLALLAPLLAYLLTACSTVYALDSAELPAAAYVLGIVRATGYPLYLLLGKAFSLLVPIGDVAFRLNAMSALCAAGTVALLYRLLWRLTGQKAAALSASLLFAFSYYFWAQAVVAEVYTLHTLLMAALLLLLFRWEATQADGLLAAFGLLYGLSLGNHMSSVLLAPGFAFFVLAVAGKKILRPRQLLLLGLPFVVGLGIYLYLPLRYQAHPAFNYAGHYDAQGNFVALDLRQPANLWWLISGQGFRGLMFDYSPLEMLKEMGQAAYWLWGNFLGIGLVPGLIGAWIQVRTRPRHFGLLALLFVMNLAFFVNYRVVDKAVMFVPAYLVWAVWIGEGFNWLIGWIQHQRRAAGHAPAWAWVLVALSVVALVVNWPLVNVRHDTRARDRAESALADADPNAIILGWWTSAPPIYYLQLVEKRRPDVLVINRFLIGAEEMYTLIDHSLGNRPVYVMELDEGLIDAYQPVPTGPMYELTPRTLAEAGP